ncbi:hypothetical protein E4T56_gene13337 [Termitomyces sp. T112]|nr:hypothetical protein E4T56_gene13337 [Termitomyces sp. T112]
MQSCCASSSHSPGQPLDADNTSSLDYLSKLGKFLGLRTTSTANAVQQQSLESLYSTPALPSSNHLTNLITSIHFFCLDGVKSKAPKSDRIVCLDCLQDRSLNHSISAPTICPHSPSEASMRCLSPTSHDVKSCPSKIFPGIHSVPTILDEKAGPLVKIDHRSNSTRRRIWNLLKGDKCLQSSHLHVHSTSAPIRRSTPSPLEATFVPAPPLWTIFPADTQDLQLVPIISHGSDISDDIDLLPNPKLSRRKSIYKLARTLGVSPYDFEPRDSPYVASSSMPDTAGSWKTNPPLNHDNTFAGLPSVLRPSSCTQPRSRSRISLSIMDTDNLRLNLADDLHDEWDEIRSESRASIYSSYSPISPIVFNPPTPTTQPLRTLPLTTNTSMEESSLTSSSRSKIGRLVPSAQATETAPDPWFIKISEDVSEARDFVVAHPEYMNEYKSWSGQ